MDKKKGVKLLIIIIIVIVAAEILVSMHYVNKWESEGAFDSSTDAEVSASIYDVNRYE